MKNTSIVNEVAFSSFPVPVGSDDKREDIMLDGFFLMAVTPFTAYVNVSFNEVRVGQVVCVEVAERGKPLVMSSIIVPEAQSASLNDHDHTGDGLLPVLTA